MKDASDQPANKEATPLFVGGAATPIKSPRNKAKLQRILRVVVVVLVVAAIAVAGWWFFIRTDPNYLNISHLNSKDKYIGIAQEYAKEPVPQSPRDKALYYGNIGLALKDGKEYVYAERYYLLAQKIVDDNNVDKKDVEFYQGLSDLYKAMGNQKKADEYTQKEADFLKANYSPEVLEQMKKAQVNDRPR